MTDPSPPQGERERVVEKVAKTVESLRAYNRNTDYPLDAVILSLHEADTLLAALRTQPARNQEGG